MQTRLSTSTLLVLLLKDLLNQHILFPLRLCSSMPILIAQGCVYSVDLVFCLARRRVTEYSTFERPQMYLVFLESPDGIYSPPAVQGSN